LINIHLLSSYLKYLNPDYLKKGCNKGINSAMYSFSNADYLPDKVWKHLNLFIFYDGIIDAYMKYIIIFYI